MTDSASRIPSRFPGFRSVRTQLVLWNTLALALLLGMLGGVIRYLVVTTIFTSVDHELEHRTQPPGGGPHRGPDGGPDSGPPDGRRDGPPPFGGPPHGSDPYHPRMFDLNGHSLRGDSTEVPWDGTGFEMARTGQEVFRTVVSDDVSLRVISHPIGDPGHQIGVIQAAYPLTDVNRAIAGTDRALLILIPVALLGAGFCAALLTGRVLERVQRLTRAAGRIGGRDLSQRLPVSGRDEFAALAETFNGLLGRLEGAFEQQRRFTADASHEMKTPLTVIRGTASQALVQFEANAPVKEAMEEIDQAAETMARLVQDLLLLARSDGGQMGRNRIALLACELLGRTVSRVSRHTATPIALTVTNDDLCVWGNEEELGRLFSNLLANAVRFTPAGGCVTVSACEVEGHTLVTVTDTGIGIAPEHLAHLGERFYRADAARARQDGGTGLGLSICRGIVEAHQGRMTFESRVGEGTTVRVLLPAPPPVSSRDGRAVTVHNSA